MSENETLNELDTELMLRFDQMADSYDARRYLSRAGVFLNQLEACIIEQWVPGGSGSLGLDIPCGTGRLTISLANRCERVIAGDISINMLRIAQEKTNRAEITNVEFQQVNGRKLPFSENTFDTVICFNLLHLIPNDQKGEFMSEFARLLRPGGRLILELKSPFFGLFLALLKYGGRLREIPRRCFLPGQGRWLFRGYRKGRAVGLGLPFFWMLRRILGMNAMMKISLALGKIPVVRSLAYVIVFEFYNEKQN